MRRLLAGLGLGALLSRVDASAPERVVEALLLRDLHLLWVALGALAASLLVRPDPRGPAWPAILMGIGVGVCGALPVTAFVQMGEGRLSAAFVLAGILIGARLCDALHSPNE